MAIEPKDEEQHRVVNALAALLANAQLLESTFAGESGERALLAESSRAERELALTAVQNVSQASQALASLLKKR